LYANYDVPSSLPISEQIYANTCEGDFDPPTREDHQMPVNEAPSAAAAAAAAAAEDGDELYSNYRDIVQQQQPIQPQSSSDDVQQQPNGLNDDDENQELYMNVELPPERGTLSRRW
jgi:hypothetical protein